MKILPSHLISIWPHSNIDFCISKLSWCSLFPFTWMYLLEWLLFRIYETQSDQPKWGDLRDCLTSPSGATWNEKWATGKYLGHDIWYGFFTLYTGKSYKRMLYHTNHVISYKTGYIWLPDQPNWGVRIGFSDVLLSAFCLLILGS